MGDSAFALAADFLDSREYSKLKAPNSLFYSDETNKL